MFRFVFGILCIVSAIYGMIVIDSPDANDVGGTMLLIVVGGVCIYFSIKKWLNTPESTYSGDYDDSSSSSSLLCDETRGQQTPGTSSDGCNVRFQGSNDFCDGAGMIRTPGESFYDSAGIRRTPGEEYFYDGVGIRRSIHEEWYYDGAGIRRHKSDKWFYDSNGKKCYKDD